MPLEIVRGDIAEVEAEAAAVELSIAPAAVQSRCWIR